MAHADEDQRSYRDAISDLTVLIGQVVVLQTALRREPNSPGNTGRELALTITHLEDARFRLRSALWYGQPGRAPAPERLVP